MFPRAPQSTGPSAIKRLLPVLDVGIRHLVRLDLGHVEQGVLVRVADDPGDLEAVPAARGGLALPGVFGLRYSAETRERGWSEVE